MGHSLVNMCELLLANVAIETSNALSSSTEREYWKVTSPKSFSNLEKVGQHGCARLPGRVHCFTRAGKSLCLSSDSDVFLLSARLSARVILLDASSAEPVVQAPTVVIFL